MSDTRQLFYVDGKDTLWSLKESDLPSKCKIAVLSSVFAGFIEELNCQSSIIAVDNINYFNDSVVLDRFNQGLIQEIGEEGQLKLEAIIKLNPDVLVCSSITFKDKSLVKRLTKSGIRLLFCDNFKEQHPLARAEWIKFFGFICHQHQLADSVFRVIEKNYLNLQNQNKNQGNPPLVLTDALYQGVWNVPGANSYTAQLIKDAGGIYAFNDKSDFYTYPLNLETVLKKASNADVWIHVNQFKSLNEMSMADPRYILFNPFSNHRVFNYNKRENISGGNDFWEKGVVRADWVLNDLSIIFQNDKNNFPNLYFYTCLD
ncbi:MAG: ABC transporter substrate-binding protein [Bacteroidia bacterium]|nr:ABC transporter substrate-binding protein [Bacteroidia bacterium]